MTYDLELLAKRAMVERGLEPSFSDAALEQLQGLKNPAAAPEKYEDLRSLLWCSIDNDDSRDLDQLTYAKKEDDGKTTIWIAVADVSALVSKESAIDRHAEKNTTSVYTPPKIFPMLPEKLSTDLTSLNEGKDRLAMVTKISVTATGEIEEGSTFQAMVHNFAKLTYSGVGAWLEGASPIPDKVKQVEGLEQALRCQNEIAQALKQKRHAMGALTLQPAKIEAKIVGAEQVTVEIPPHNLASQLIEHFMIAANHVMANHFKTAKIPSLRRVVKTPLLWDNIVKIAASLKMKLPKDPDSKALDQFLVERKRVDPDTFPDLSLTVIKLLGSGEYVVETSDDPPEGHFGLALSEYTHSTAPNRRFPDLITQRQYKAFLMGQSNPYSIEELNALADHCTKQEDAAKKVERQLTKSAAALFLSSEIGAVYEGIITGASPKGTWVRCFHPPVEGKIVAGYENLEIGDHVGVKLVHVDVLKGFIDFVKVSTHG